MLKQFFTKFAPACANLQLALLALFVLGSPTAQAQAAPTEVMLANNAGCKLFHPVGPGVIDAQLLNAAGNCVDGFFQGAVLYGVSWSVDITNRPSRQFAGVRAAVMQQGRIDGVHLFMNPTGIVGLRAINQPVAYSSEKNSTAYSLPQLLSAINTEVAKASGQDANALRAHLTNIASTWDRNSDGMINAYTADTSNPRVAINGNVPAITSQPSQASSSNNARDDPKVFGRSARGG